MDVEALMRLAIAEAAKGHGFVSPNPKVGAVLVKNGKVVSTGYHKFFGDAHAEVNCLNSYAQSLEGDEIMYVTLEPCAHEGKQPACADYLINKGMRRVVVANMDPNPKVAGLGIKRLRAAGVNVEVGLLNEEAAKLNFGFFKYIKTNRPYLILKIAMNMFGQIAPLPRARAQISGLKAGRFVKDLRSKVDGILVGAGTLQVDNPELAAGCVNGYEPRRIVLGDVQSDLTLKVFRDQNVWMSWRGQALPVFWLKVARRFLPVFWSKVCGMKYIFLLTKKNPVLRPGFWLLMVCRSLYGCYKIVLLKLR